MGPRQLAGDGLGTAIRGTVPDWLLPAFVVLTELGNPGFLMVVFTLDYWYGDHERGAHAIGLAIAGMALVTTLKYYFHAPRPPEAVNVIAIAGYSFPSGHATTATIGYGILAHDMEIGTPLLRYAVAAVLVAFVALSRVVLGVHFVRDVLAGVLVGSIFLAGAILLTKHAPRPAYLLAVALGAVALFVSGASQDGVAVLGAALGGAVTWEVLDAVPSVDSLSQQVTLAGLLLPLAAVGYVSTRPWLGLPAVFALNVLLIVGVLTAPRILGWEQ